MIKINLLAVDRDRVKKKSKFPGGGEKITVGCSLILMAAALFVGWWYWSLQNESKDVDQQIVDIHHILLFFLDEASREEFAQFWLPMSAQRKALLQNPFERLLTINFARVDREACVLLGEYLK